MAKPRRSDATSREKAAIEAPSFVNQRAFPPDPPRRHPWFLVLSALSVAAWLLFLLWMAIKAHG